MDEESSRPKAIYQNELDRLNDELDKIPRFRESNRYDECVDSLSVDEQAALSKLEGICKLCEMLKGDLYLAHMATGTMLKEAIQKVNAAKILVRKFMNILDSDKTATLDRARQWMNSQRDAADTHYGEVHAVIGNLINWGRITAERKIDDMLGSRKQQFDEIVYLRESADSMVSEIEALRERADEFLRSEGIAAHADMMKDEASSHARRAIAWGIATFGFCAGSFWSAVHFWEYLVPGLSEKSPLVDMSSGAGLQMAVLKLALGSVVMFLIVFCARACQSHMHNATVNRHRYQALRTFELFKDKGTVQGPTYEALLLYVAQAIFAPQRTGFIGKDPSVSAMTPAIRIAQEVAKAATPG